VTTEPAAATLIAVLSVLAATAVPHASTETDRDLSPAVSEMLATRCGICHAGSRPRMGLNLEPARLYRSTVNVPSRSDPELLLVAPGDPDASLLYRKLLPPEEGWYHGQRMPQRGKELDDAEMELVHRWIASFPEEVWGRSEKAPEERRTWSFQGSFLVNLPTTEALRRNGFSFRIAHRFRGDVTDAGLDDLFGIDTGAWVSLGLAYGISRRWEVGLQHSTYLQQEEVYAKVAALEQTRGSPISLSVLAGASYLRETGLANRGTVNLQVILGRRFGRVSLLAVPSWSDRVNFNDPGTDGGTLALGLGAEWHLTPKFAILGEWVGQLSGVKDEYQSASLGFGIRTARHVFQLVATNTRGMQTPIYLPGGDLDWLDGDFRLGFNLTRFFGVR
jgi:hypothetical protein